MKELEFLLMEQLKKIAKQNLVDRDWYDISTADIEQEMRKIVEGYIIFSRGELND